MKKKVALFLDRLNLQKSLKDKQLFVFGANASGTIIINDLIARGLEVAGVLDNNPLLENSMFLEIKVTTPEQAFTPFIDNAVILIASRYYDEMKLQLEQLGYIENEHIYKVVDLNPNSDFNLSWDTTNKYISLAERGVEVYERLCRKYNSRLIVMSPVKPNGDTYMICSYLNSFIQNNYNGESYVLTVVGKSCQLTAELFNIENIELLDTQDNISLVTLANFYPDRVQIISPYYKYQEIYHHLDGYKGLTFIEEIKHGLMGLNKNTEPQFPNTQISDERLNELCLRYGIEKGNSVIIAPFANSIPLINNRFWEQLVASLKLDGYKVFTNCGTLEEVPIKGSERIFYEFEEAVAISEYAGTVISYRSGFCEIIARSKCKKIVIYPDHIKGHSSLRVLFGMEDQIYEQERLYQITNTYKYTNELLDEVMRVVRED